MSVLSIQSFVAYGHVGNSVAAFALQRLGVEVMPVPTVVLSNHAAYPTVRGQRLSPDTVHDVVRGLAERGALTDCAAVLSGYLGDAALGATVLDAVAEARAANPRALYCCDPVMGEADKGLYVSEAIAGFFRDAAIPAADIATPNAFEAGRLTGVDTTTLDGARAAAAALLRSGPDKVAITSLRHEPDAVGVLLADRHDAWLVSTPLIEGHRSGTGDLFAALLLGHLLLGRPLSEAGALSVASIHGVLRRTLELGRAELALVAAQDELAAPSRRVEAVRL
ncbi:MAG: pyridoxal kinase PdxY [Acetobacterales bacterium]